jgi:hypothetical protein
MDYREPKVVDYGDLKDVTAASSSGTHLDKDFSAGTLIGDLTFS